MKLTSLSSVLSIDFNDRHLETAKRYASGSVHSWIESRCVGPVYGADGAGQIWLLGDMDQARKVCTASLSAGNRRSKVNCGRWGTWTRSEKCAQLACLQGTEGQRSNVAVGGIWTSPENPAEERPLGSTSRKWEDNIKMDVT